VNTHSQIHERSSLPTSYTGRAPQMQPGPVFRPGVLAWVLLTAILAVVIASSIANSGADHVASERAAPGRGVPVGLVGGLRGLSGGASFTRPPATHRRVSGGARRGQSSDESSRANRRTRRLDASRVHGRRRARSDDYDLAHVPDLGLASRDRYSADIGDSRTDIGQRARLRMYCAAPGSPVIRTGT